MEVRWDLLLVVLGAAIVTLLPRVIPLLVLSKVGIPEWGLRWLGHIPIAILAALLAQTLFMYETMKVDYLVAAIPTFLVAIFTRSLLGAVLTGVIVVFLLRFFLSIL
ncbi:AzlD domain-containing protein [Bacillus sp. BP-3]|uniref:AzlD domain-containing protein n=1 Tax=Bacillus sp. BP-3 TaxID=3022773 RepID=UPI00232DBEB4|nr:AzlD domain-containing protein [Bacillus sp. BP-3]MDC2865782.1 AzlD domain-containing protein [Bacillus sp. BP-3]